MSYDLYFARKDTGAGSASLDHAAMMRFFKSLPHFTVNTIEGGFEAWYENREKRTHFLIISRAGRHWEDVPEGFAPVDLHFEMGYREPAFAGEEAMPLVEKMAEAFGLWVIDLQDHETGGNGSPKPCRARELLETWNRSQQKVIDAPEPVIGQSLKKGRFMAAVLVIFALCLAALFFRQHEKDQAYRQVLRSENMPQDLIRQQ